MSEVLERLGAFEPFGSLGQPRRYLVLDVFTSRPLEGNQLAVFTDGRGLQGATMQAIACELRLSESVFMLPAQSGGDIRVRIFTPSAELPFAGHPVLGSAIVLGSALERGSVVLETGSGLVPVEVEPIVERTAFARMSQPVPTVAPFPWPAELLAALGVERSELAVEEYVNGPRHLFVALGSAAAVTALEPDLRALTLCAGEAGVSCFAAEGDGFRTRMFAPGMGVPEDPATGSAAGPLAVHLARHGVIAFGQEIEIRQGAELGRPSLLLARAAGSSEQIESVSVGGNAALQGRGELWPP